MVAERLCYFFASNGQKVCIFQPCCGNRRRQTIGDPNEPTIRAESCAVAMRAAFLAFRADMPRLRAALLVPAVPLHDLSGAFTTPALADPGEVRGDAHGMGARTSLSDLELRKVGGRRRKRNSTRLVARPRLLDLTISRIEPRERDDVGGRDGEHRAGMHHGDGEELVLAIDFQEGIHPDHFARFDHQRATGISRIDRAVRLQPERIRQIIAEWETQFGTGTVSVHDAPGEGHGSRPRVSQRPNLCSARRRRCEPQGTRALHFISVGGLFRRGAVGT